MPLKSSALAGDERLEACLIKDSAHLTLGTQGDFVAKVQSAIMFLDDLSIDDAELDSATYGKSTAKAVLKFKQKRKIINPTYQKSEDDIVGKMTIKAIDDELVSAENAPLDTGIEDVCPERI
jgi:hypothetical protein